MADQIPARELFDQQRSCQNCGEYVTKQFVRVFGSGGEVQGCMNCMTGRQLRNGEAAQK